MYRILLALSILLTGLNVTSSEAADTPVPLLELEEKDFWRPGEPSFVAEYNLWAWGAFGAPVAREIKVPAAFSAGNATTFSKSEEAYSAPFFTLDPGTLRAFAFGRHLFRRNWKAAPASVEGSDGLGPTYNRVSCAGCHLRDGRGRPPASPEEPMKSMLVRLSVPGVGANGGPVPHPVYGGQLQDKSILGIPEEGRATIHYSDIAGTFADGEAYRLRRPTYHFTDLRHGPLGDDILYSPRVAPAIHGLGLLEAVDDALIFDAADPDDSDGDGISGKVNLVWDSDTGRQRLGRFGWKANTASLRGQVAGAALGDMGITTSLFPSNNCTPAQDACVAAPTGGAPELSDQHLDMLVVYAQTLAVPARRTPDDPIVRRGEALFAAAGCAGCHTPTLSTGTDTLLPQLANLTIHPYTDLLLHDMGEGLADNRPDFAASGREWRTPPLWGVGLVQRVNLHRYLLHDGRARGVMEAVLWHGGEAAAARDAVRAMPKTDRDALVAFLRSL